MYREIELRWDIVDQQTRLEQKELPVKVLVLLFIEKQNLNEIWLINKLDLSKKSFQQNPIFALYREAELK